MCSVEGCPQATLARGLCQMHYWRLHSRGNVGSAQRERSKARTIEEVFWDKVSDNGSKCWEWRAHRNRQGYGVMGWQKKTRFAHRVSAELFLGFIPAPGLCVLHKCDNPPCVNPAHLFIGTYTDNARDRQQKGRGRFPQGESCNLAKLTEEEVLKMRELFAAGRHTYTGLGRMFHCSISTAREACLRITWKHI